MDAEELAYAKSLKTEHKKLMSHALADAEDDDEEDMYKQKRGVWFVFVCAPAIPLLHVRLPGVQTHGAWRLLTPAHPPRRYGNEDDYSSPIDDVDELLVFALALSAAQQRHPSVPASLPPHVQAQVRARVGGRGTHSDRTRFSLALSIWG